MAVPINWIAIGNPVVLLAPEQDQEINQAPAELDFRQRVRAQPHRWRRGRRGSSAGQGSRRRFRSPTRVRTIGSTSFRCSLSGLSPVGSAGHNAKDRMTRRFGLECVEVIVGSSGKRGTDKGNHAEPLPIQPK